MTEVTTLRAFEIVTNEEDWAIYRVVQDVELGASGPIPAIEQFQATSELSNGMRSPPLHSRCPERFLDIHEDRPDGVYTYAFWLNHERDKQYPASFADTPIETVDIGHNEVDSFFVNIQRVHPQWATLSVDVAAIRGSGIADAIRNRKYKSIQIPFHFKILDAEFGFSPILLPNNHHHRAVEAKGPGIIHGGIHPPAVSFFNLTL